MQLIEFKELLQIYGADLTRWPQGSVKAAEKLMQESEEARNEYAAHSEIDAIFSYNKDINAPPGLLERIMGAIKQQKF